MVAYFCHYLSDSNVDLSDLSADLPVFDISVDWFGEKVSKLDAVYILVSCYIACAPKCHLLVDLIFRPVDIMIW